MHPISSQTGVPVKNSLISENKMEKLPEELILKIFSLLKAEDLCQINQLNKNFYEVSLNSSLWIPLLKENAPKVARELIDIYRNVTIFSKFLEEKEEKEKSDQLLLKMNEDFKMNYHWYVIGEKAQAGLAKIGQMVSY